MTDEREYPPWDGRPLTELPEGAITDPGELEGALVEIGLSGEDIVEGLKLSPPVFVEAGEVAWDWESNTGTVVLWLPWLEEERMTGPLDEDDRGREISTVERWRNAESAISVLSLGSPRHPVELGFVIGERVTRLPWFEFCAHYDLPPQSAVAAWS